MKKYLVLVLLLFWSGPGFSQPPWQATTPFPKENFFATNTFTISPATDAIFVSTEEEGLQRSADNGNSWETVLNETIYTVQARADGTIFAGGAGTVYTSSDDGKAWTTSPAFTTYPISAFVFNTQGHIFASTSNYVLHSSNGLSGSGIFTSTDNGLTWHNLNSGLPSLNVVALAIDSKDRLYIGTNENEAGMAGGLYTKGADENTWTRIPVDVADLEDIRITYFHMMGLDKHDHLYISVEGASGKIGVLRTLKSEDTGASWRIFELQESTTGLYYDEMYLLSLFLSRSGTLWTSIPRRLGIYFSDDHGNNWVRHMNGMPSSYNIVNFAEATDGRLYTLKRYDSNVVFSMQSPLSAEEPAAGDAISLQLYPNPFRDNLSVALTLEAPADIQVRITDALGKLVFEQEQHFSSGAHTLSWNSGTTAAGLYIVQVQAGSKRMVQKVLLTR